MAIKDAAHSVRESPAGTEKSSKTATEAQVRDALDRARQNVKQIVQRELEGERVGSKILNLRLK